MPIFHTREAVIDQQTAGATAILATETEVDRGAYIEVLSVQPGSVDFESRSPIPLLDGHDHGQQIGVVENIRFEGRALVGDLRFRANEEGQEAYQAVKDRIVTRVSVGYRIIEADDNSTRMNVTQWELMELSLVAVPADENARITQVRNLEMDATKQTRSERIADKNNANQIKQDIRSIYDLAQKHDRMDLAEKAMESDWGLERFRSALLESIPTGKPFTHSGAPTMEATQTDFSLTRAINGVVNGDKPESVGLTRGKLEGNTYAVPQLAQRDVLKSGTGSNLVGTDHLADRFVDRLSPLGDLLSRVTMLTGLTGQISVPKMTAGSTAAFFAEGATITESTPTFGQITMNGNLVAGLTEVSTTMIRQGSPAVDLMLGQDLRRSVEQKMEQVVINGSGSGAEPEGILNTSGIGAVALGTNGAAPTYSALLDLIAEVAADNADTNGVFVMNARTASFLRKTPKVASTDSVMILEGDSIAGRPVVINNQMPADLTKGTGTALNAIVYGDLSHVMVGQWGSTELLIDPYTKADSGMIRMRTLALIDVAVRYPEAFAAITDADIS